MPAVAPYAANRIGTGWRMSRIVSASAYAVRTGARLADARDGARGERVALSRGLHAVGTLDPLDVAGKGA